MSTTSGRDRRDLRATNETHEPLPVPECDVTFDSLPVDSPAVTPATQKVKENCVSTPPKVPTPLKPLPSNRKTLCGNQIKFRPSYRVIKLPRKLEEYIHVTVSCSRVMNFLNVNFMYAVF